MLLPTKAALIRSIKKAHFQCIVGIMTLLLIQIYHNHQSMDGERKLGDSLL